MSRNSTFIRDFDAMGWPRKASRLNVFRAFITDAGFRAVCLYRIGRRCRTWKLRPLPALIERLIGFCCNCRIATSADIAPGFVIRHVGDLIVGMHCKIGPGCEVRQGVTIGGAGTVGPDGRVQPVLKENVWVGTGAKLLGPITIGANSVIGANAVVLADVPPDSAVAGVPARVVRRNGKKVPLIERRGELAAVLQDILARVDRLEARLDADETTRPPHPPSQ